MTLEELKRLYGEKGATQRREEQTEQGTKYYDDAVQYGDGWTAWENQPTEIIDYIGQGMDATPVYKEVDPANKLGGFSKQEGDYITDYDLTGKPIAKRKWNESDWVTMRNDLGPIAMAALSGYLGGIPLGETGLTAGNLLSGARAIENKDLLGLLSSGAGAFDTSGIDIGGLNAKDAMKYAGIAKNALSGTDAGLFSAITGLATDQNLANALGPGDMKQFEQDLIPGYFLPGGEGYVPSELNKTYGPTEEFDPSQTDWAALYADTSRGSPAGLNVADFPNQDFGVDPNKNWDSYMNTMNQISNKDGFGSQWQTLGTNRVMINDDGGATVLDPTTQQTSFLTQEQVDALVKNGSLNSEESGYVKATGGKNGVPGGTKTPIKTVTPTKTTTPSQDLMKALGATNVVQAPMQDPFADIKLMEEVFGPDIAYKLRALGRGDATKKTAASSNVDALTKLLRG